MPGIEKIISCMDDYDPNALNVAKARAAIHACLTPPDGHEQVNVRAALGRILAQDIISPIDVPLSDNSAMDGWALRGADLTADGETRLQEVGTAYAGRAWEGVVQAGQCVRIMTGAVMPQGADTVVIQENVRAEGGHVYIPAGEKAGQNVRRAGEDLARGKAVLHAGHCIRPAELGLMASLGMAEVAVRRRLRVAFFSTGDELASVGTTLKQGEVYDSNRYTIYGMLRRLDVDILDMGVVRDDPAALERAFLEAAASADAIITSGGVSVGEADYTRDILARLGEVLFWKIAMKPGRPMAFGKVGNAFFFGLPGNPVAVMVSFYQFVRGALLALAGRGSDGDIPLLRVPCRTALRRKRPGRTEFLRGMLTRGDDGTWQVASTGAQGSGVLRSMSEANCFIVLEHERGPVEPGDLVSVQLMEGLI